MAIMFTLEEVEEWKTAVRAKEAGKDEPPPTDPVLETVTADNDQGEEKEEVTPSKELGFLMERFCDSISGYSPLIHFSSLWGPALQAGYIQSEMYQNAGRDFSLIGDGEGFETFGATVDQYPALSRNISRLREIDKGATALPGATLLSLVATFDSFVADTVRVMLKSNSERFANSDKTITIRDLLAMNSFDDAVDKIIDEEIDGLMRGSHDGQVGFIEKNFNIKIRDDHDEWADFIEIFERRNLVAHGNCIINNRYIENCNRHGYEVSTEEIGEELSLDRRYLRRSADRLMEFGLLLAFVLWRKHFPADDEDAYRRLGDLAYRLISDGRPRIAARILEFALFKQTPSVNDRRLKMMTVNLANAYKKIKNDARAQEIIDTVDWSASADEFKISIASLKGDIEGFVELMPRVAQNESVTKSEFREWPVFDWVRNEEVVRNKFEELFNEPLIKPNKEEVGMAEVQKSNGEG